MRCDAGAVSFSYGDPTEEPRYEVGFLSWDEYSLSIGSF